MLQLSTTSLIKRKTFLVDLKISLSLSLGDDQH